MKKIYFLVVLIGISILGTTIFLITGTLYRTQAQDATQCINREPSTGDYCYSTYYYVHYCDGSPVTGTCPAGYVCQGGEVFSGTPGNCVPQTSGTSTTGGTSSGATCGVYSSKSQCDSLCANQTAGTACNSTCSACVYTNTSGGNACDQFGGQAQCTASGACAQNGPNYECSSDCTMCVLNGGTSGNQAETLTLTFTPTTPPQGTVGQQYPSLTISATGSIRGHIPFSSLTILTQSLPPGLSLVNGDVATITGVPTQPGNFPISLLVSENANTSANISQQITINPTGGQTGVLNLTLSPSTPPQGTVGQSYPGVSISADDTVKGHIPFNQLTVVNQTVPPGLTLSTNGDHATLIGFPTQAGTFPFAFTVAENANTSASINKQIVIQSATGGTTTTGTSGGTNTTGTSGGTTGSSSGGTTAPPPSPSISPSGGYTVTGKITDSQTGNAISGVHVLVFDGTFNQQYFHLTTDSTGSFSTSSLRPGDLYAVRIESEPDGYGTAKITTGNTTGCGGTEIPAGSASYECQTAGTADCGQSCNFTLDPLSSTTGGGTSGGTSGTSQSSTTTTGNQSTTTTTGNQTTTTTTGSQSTTTTTTSGSTSTQTTNGTNTTSSTTGGTSGPTPPLPTQIIAPTTVEIQVKLPGIGSGAGDNNNPLNKTINAQVILLQQDKTTVAFTSLPSPLTFNGNTYAGQVLLPPNFTTGIYFGKVKIDNNLVRYISVSQFQVTAGQNVTIGNPIFLIGGDISGDNRLDLSDYNILIGCYGSKSCTQKVQADLNQDGIVDEKDLNILLRGVNAQTVGN